MTQISTDKTRDKLQKQSMCHFGIKTRDRHLKIAHSAYLKAERNLQNDDSR